MCRSFLLKMAIITMLDCTLMTICSGFSETGCHMTRPWGLTKGPKKIKSLKRKDADFEKSSDPEGIFYRFLRRLCPEGMFKNNVSRVRHRDSITSTCI